MGPGNTGNLVGRTLGEYRLEALLGAGGMAEVYQGQDIALEREVAIKVLPASLAADAGYVERFREEAKRVALLSHPHIVPVYAYGEQDGLLYLVMPILRESLRDRMGRQPIFPPNDAARIVVQIASALDAAHAQGIVHRDVKPENILLDAEGKAHLTDFGIARDMDFLKQTGTNRTLAATGLPVGTPEYMAPEQLRAALVDQRADIYALGAVLYELLTGTVPHEASTPYEVAALVLTAPLVAPSERNPDLWPALDEVVMVALSTDAEQRFPNMRRFAMALRRAVVEKDAGLAKLTMPARSLTGIPAVALAQAAALTGSGKRRTGAAVAEWPPIAQTGPLREFPVKPADETNGRRFLLIAILVVVALVGVLGGSGIALLNTLGSGGGQAHNTATTGSGVPIVGSGPGASATNTTVAATQVAGGVIIGATATSAAATSTAEGTPNPTATTGPGTPTPTANPTATATAVPAPPLSFTVLNETHHKGGYCTSGTTGAQTITNNGATVVTWRWISVSAAPNGNGNSPSGTFWGFSNPTTPGYPQDSNGLAAQTSETIQVAFTNCNRGDHYIGTATDGLNHTYTFNVFVS